MSSVNQRDRVFLKLFLRTTPSELGEEEMAYFREHPDQIDEVTAPVNGDLVHRFALDEKYKPDPLAGPAVNIR